MNQPMIVESALRWLLTYAVHSAVLAAAGVALAGLWLKPGSRRGLVLRVALFGALLSASLPWKLLAPLSLTETPADRVALTTPELAAGPGSQPLLTEPAPLASEQRRIPAAAPFALERRDWMASASQALPWSLGALFALSLFLVSALYDQRRRFLSSLQSEPLEDAESLQLLDAWAREAGIAKVSLTYSERLRAPIALSAREICVPSACWKALSGEDRRAVLAHEFAHIERRDPLWFSAAAALERIFFFLPWHRSLRRRLNASAEVACDALAAKRVGSSAAVARCLASVAAWGASQPTGLAVPASVAAMAAGPGELVDRVRQLLTETDRPVGRPFAAGAVLGLAGFACCAPAITANEERPSNTAAMADTRGIRGDIEVEVKKDGTVTARRSADYPPLEPLTVLFQGRDNKAKFTEWLRKAAADLPSIIPPGFEDRSIDWDIHGGAFVISGDADVEMKYALHLMSQAGDRDVSMPDVRLAVGGRIYQVPLPVDIIHPPMPPVVKLDVRLDAVDIDDPRAGLTYQIGSALGAPGISVPVEDAPPIPEPVLQAATTLSGLEVAIEESIQRMDGDERGVEAAVDPRKGTRFGSVAEVLRILEGLGVKSIRFKGSYEQ